jgi:nanoRNase/pAp phosphatase (c-di-AMP/oligoRNAs hydrolase)
MPQATTTFSRSSELLSALGKYRRVAIIMHDNPDPDAIASGWAISVLVQEKLGIPVRLLGSGAIVRAENRHMVDLLMPPIELVSELDLDAGTASVLVDCGLGTTNHLGTRSGIMPVAVVDHHLHRNGEGTLPFVDIRTAAAATASIAAGYLREQRVDPGMKLATAILYAIRTETRGSETSHSPMDRAVVTWLTEFADPTLLAEIENAPLEVEYFGDLVLAMQRTFIYDDAALCFLQRASGAEIVGEVADLLVRCRGIRRVLCAAVIGDDLLLSVRTQRDTDNAARLLQATLDGVGGCGGHAHRAGGKVPDVGNKFRDDLNDELRARWLKACAVDRLRGTRLVPRREIIENLS